MIYLSIYIYLYTLYVYHNMCTPMISNSCWPKIPEAEPTEAICDSLRRWTRGQVRLGGRFVTRRTRRLAESDLEGSKDGLKPAGGNMMENGKWKDSEFGRFYSRMWKEYF